LSAELTKTHSFRLSFSWFCPLGRRQNRKRNNIVETLSI